jgi:hypothetical protein
VNSEQWTVNSGQWRVNSVQIALNSGEWEVDSGEWAVYSVKWAITVGSRQWTFKFGLAIFSSFASFYVASENN